MLASLVGVLLIALVLGLLAYAFLRAPDSAPVGRPGIAGPPPPPSPPAPPDAPVGIGRPRAPAARDGIPDELIFPGSKTVLDAIDSDKWVRQLSTLEPMSEVEDWYSEKVVDAKRIRVPGGVVIFEKDGLKVVLTPTERGTNILLTRER